MGKYRAEEPRYLWYCGTKKYREGDGTGTVEKWYRGAAVVPWYRATLVVTSERMPTDTVLCTMPIAHYCPLAWSAKHDQA